MKFEAKIKDRIYEPYGLDDFGLSGAQMRGDWDSTKSLEVAGTRLSKK